MKLGTIDILVFVVYITIIMLIGFLSGRKGGKSKENYFLAGRALPWYVIGFSLIASSISTEQFIGEVGWGYKYGLAVANWEWLVWPAQGLLLYFFMPVYLKNKIYTIPEYLARRFNERTGTTFAMVCITMYLIINLPLVLYSGGFVMYSIFGINLYFAIWLLSVTAGAYAIYGGLSSVVWTDLIQGVLLIAGGLLVFVLGILAVPGGLTEIIGTGDRAHLLLPVDHPELPWTGILVVAVVTGGFYYSTNQFITQRCLAAKSLWHGKMGIVLAAGLAFPLALSVTWPGMIAYALNPALENVDSAYPYLIHRLVPAGLRGVMFAVLIGAIMSTVDSLLNSTSTLFTLDIYQKYFNKTASDRKLVRTAQLMGVVMLLFCTLWAPMVGKFGTIFAYVQETWTMMMSPLMALFLLAIFWKKTTIVSAITALVMAFPALVVVFLRQFFGLWAETNVFHLAGLFFLLSMLIIVMISLYTTPVSEERIKTSVWRKELFFSTISDHERALPWFKSVNFWFGVVVVFFVALYTALW
jgi:SSS family solute:Na+ symporter